jgi:hypothetical protein
MSAELPDAVRLYEARRTPPLGGFNRTFLWIEIRRLLRNRRTVIVTVAVPIVVFLLLRSNKRIVAADGVSLGAATTMIGIAVYGAMLASPRAGRWCRSSALSAGAASCGSPHCGPRPTSRSSS